MATGVGSHHAKRMTGEPYSIACGMWRLAAGHRYGIWKVLPRYALQISGIQRTIKQITETAERMLQNFTNSQPMKGMKCRMNVAIFRITPIAQITPPRTIDCSA